jgi:hypothetical protein
MLGASGRVKNGCGRRLVSSRFRPRRESLRKTFALTVFVSAFVAIVAVGVAEVAGRCLWSMGACRRGG